MKKTAWLLVLILMLNVMLFHVNVHAEPVVTFDANTMTVTYAERDLQVPLNCTVYLAAYKNNRLVGVSAKYVGRYNTLADIAIAVSERPDKAAVMVFDATLWPIEEKREYSIADMTQRLIRDSVTVEEYFEDYYESGNIGTFEYYKTLEDAGTTKVAIDLKNCTFYYNGEEVSREEMDQEYGLDYLMVEMADRITFEGPKDGYIDTVIIQDYSHRQIEAVDAENQYIKLTNGEELYLDPSYRSGNFTYNIYDETGKVLSVQDLKKNDVLSIVAPLYNGLAGDFDSVPFMDIYVSDQTVTGIVTEKIYTNTFVINGEKYDLDENADIKVGDEGVFFLTIDGKIYDSSAVAAKNNNSAFIVAYGSDSAFGVNTHQLKLCTSEGNLETYDVAPSLKVYEETEYGYRAYIYKRNDRTQDDFFYYLEDFIADQETKADAIANLEKRMVTFRLNSNNEISELRFAGRSIEEFRVSYYENMLYNASVPTLGGYLLDENAIVFQTPVTEIWDGCYNVDEDDVLAIKLSDANLQSEKRYSGYVYTIGDNDTAKVVLFTEKFINKIGVWEVQDFDENTGELSYVGEDGEDDSVFLNDATIIYHNGKVLSASEIEKNGGLKSILLHAENMEYISSDGQTANVIYITGNISADVENEQLGFIAAYGSDVSFGVKTHQLKLFTSEGKLETYDVASALKVYEETEYGYRAYIYKRNDRTQDELFYYLEDFIADQETKADAIANLEKRMVTFRLNSDSEISELRFAGRDTEEFSVSYSENMLYNASVPTLGGYLLDENAIVFQTPVTEIWDECYNVDEDDVLAIKLSDANLQSEKRYSGYVYTIGDNDTAKAVLFTEKFINKIGVWEVQDFDENTGELSYVGEDGEDDSVFLNDTTIIYHNGKVLTASEIEKNGGLKSILLHAENMEYISSDGQTANVVIYITGNISADVENEQLGFIAAYGSDVSFGVNTHQLKLFTSEGKLETYDVAPALKVYEETEYGYRAYIYKRNDRTQDDFFDYLADFIVDQETKADAIANLEKRMVTFRLNSNNEISELKLAGGDTGDFYASYRDNAMYNEQIPSLGNVLLDEKSCLFVAPVTEIAEDYYNVDEEDIYMLPFSELDDKKVGGYSMIFYQSDNQDALLAALSGKEIFKSFRKEHLAVVKTKSIGIDAEGCDVDKYTFVQSGEIITKAVDYDEMPSIEAMSIGDVFLYGTNADGEICETELFYNASARRFDSGQWRYEDYDINGAAIIYGRITEVKNGLIKLDDEMWFRLETTEKSTYAKVTEEKMAGNNPASAVSSLSDASQITASYGETTYYAVAKIGENGTIADCVVIEWH